MLMKILTLESFGGKAAVSFDNTVPFTLALEALRDSGGGILDVSPGVWSTGPIQLYSNTHLRLSEGAVVFFIPESELYRPVFTRWEGIECWAMHPCIFCSDQSDVSITGKGCIDGNGVSWWNALRTKIESAQTRPEWPIELELARLNPGWEDQPGGGGGRKFQFLRPPAVQFYKCRNILVEGITIRNSPFWTLHPVYCDTVTVSGVTISNPHDAPNTDGMDIDSCSNVLVTGCTIGVGDDGIALKSGSGADGIRVNKPTRNVTVRNCTVGDGHGGIVIGSETAAGMHDILTENCVFKGTDRGIRIKTRRGRGGDIYNLTFRNLVMEDNLCPIAINMYYRCGASFSEKELFSLSMKPVSDVTPRIRDILISNVRATRCRASAGFLAGLPESPIRNLRMEDCVFETDEESGIMPGESEMYLGIPEVSAKSFRVLNVLSPVFTNVTVTGPEKPFTGL